MDRSEARGLIERMKELYGKRSKHSHYQRLPEILENHLTLDVPPAGSRYERERLAFISERVRMEGKTVADIGGNCGYFSFAAIELNARHVHYFEGNRDLVEFFRLAVRLTGLEKRVEISPVYWDPEIDDRDHDITLLLNVLHHLGGDWDDGRMSMEDAKGKIIQVLRTLANMTEVLVFQMGFCWKGDTSQLLFAHGTKQEMIAYLKEGLRDSWEFQSIGVATRRGAEVVYEEVNRRNIERDDALGEFLNRPIFIMRSRRLPGLQVG